jgi:hypothetical protein
MQKFLFLCLITVNICLPGALRAEEDEPQSCVMPQAPTIPDGRTSKEEVMLTTMEAVKTFLALNNQYRECLGTRLATLSDNPEEAALKKAIGGAIDEADSMEELVADTFNTQARIFKAIHEE